MEVYLNGQTIKLDPRKSIGKGGEADVFDIGKGKALKIFKAPDHPDYDGLPVEQQAAKLRISIHQRKLPAFPSNLPESVIKPEELATDSKNGVIIGYSMKYLPGASPLRHYSQEGTTPPNFDKNILSSIFLDLYNTISKIHKAGVIIGDLNDLNILIEHNKAYFIDTDSFQFEDFYCMVYTARFIDPLLANRTDTVPSLSKPYNTDSDWFAFSVMLFQSLLHVHPYGGVFCPADPSQRLSHEARPLRRISVFHPEVRYPKSAKHYSVLPDELIQYFQQVFLLDKRSEFPVSLIKMIKWTKCSHCKTEYARNLCPNCIKIPESSVKSTTIVRGDVTITRIFKTDGTIVAASPCEGKLNWLYYDKKRYCREDGTVIAEGELTPKMKFGLSGKTTIIGEGSEIILFSPGKPNEHLHIDRFETKPAFDSNQDSVFIIRNGQLKRMVQNGQEYIGDVLEAQTFIQTGLKFGFGYFRAGAICVSFVFDAKNRGINDTLSIPFLKWPVLNAECHFAGDLCWFFLTTQEQGYTINRCITINSKGYIIASLACESGDGSWLGNPFLKGKCAAGSFLLVATDDGIIRVETENGTIVKTKEFPDTSGFVDERTMLFPGKGGLFIIHKNEVSFIKIQ